MVKLDIFLNIMFSPITLPWLAVGSIKDFIEMFRILGRTERDDTDDGRVIEKVLEYEAEAEQTVADDSAAG